MKTRRAFHVFFSLICHVCLRANKEKADILSLHVFQAKGYIFMYYIFVKIPDNMCHSFQSSSDSLEYLAPFVAEEDMLQLNSDPFPIMDVNFPELDLSGYAFESSFGKQIQVCFF